MDSRIAFLFPGQGSQTVGMGKSFIENSQNAKARFGEASEILKLDLVRLCLEGPKEALAQTENAQVALFVLSVAICQEILDKGIQPICLAGHSLGEYPALWTGGAYDFEQGVKLVRFRGERMAEAGRKNPGIMVAIIGLSWEIVKQLCRDVQTGVVVPANWNLSEQIVISGETVPVRYAAQEAKKLGAKVVELQVSGAFHSPLMRSAQEAMKEYLDLMEFQPLRADFISNVTGERVKDSDEAKALLVRQLAEPVLWCKCMETINQMVDKGLELGAGKVLTGLMKKAFPKFDCLAIDSFEQLKLSDVLFRI